MKASVVIPTYDGIELLEKSLSRLFKALNEVKDYEVIVVDNGSSDRSIQMLRQIQNSKFKILKNRENIGFAKAVNQGAEKAKGPYLLILNNDCFVEKETVIKMINFLEKHKEYVATQPVIHRLKTQNSKLKSASKKLKVTAKEIENIGYMVDTWVGRVDVVTHKSQIPLHQISGQTNSRFIYGLSATCLLIRRDVFVKVGMFDESFHSYLEDVDLFIRLHKNGYKYAPTFDASCTHSHMATSSKMGIYKETQDFKNWIRIIIKNYSFAFILRHFPFLFVERLRNINGIIKKLIQ